MILPALFATPIFWPISPRSALIPIAFAKDDVQHQDWIVFGLLEAR